MLGNREQSAMNSIPLSSLVSGLIAPADYLNEKGELLIAKGTRITRRHIEMLENRNTLELFCAPATEEEELAHLLNQEMKRIDLSDLLESGTIDVRSASPGKMGFEELLHSPVARGLDDQLRGQVSSDRPSGTALKTLATQVLCSERNDHYKAGVSDSYFTSLRDVESLLTMLVTNKNASIEDVAQIVKRFVRIFITDRNILLNISNIKHQGEEFLFHHSLNVCLLGINIAASYGYSEDQIVEIGIGALLHDIGMLLVPQSIRTKPMKLTMDERYEIQKHPVFGLHLLENIKNIPDRIAYIAYQVHERENATGYPKQRKSQLIHRFAKMVQVADVFEALTSRRPHRAPYLPSESIVKIIQMSKAGLIATDAVRALLEYASLFPVGSLVELSNRRIAKVVAANKSNLHLPVVSVLTDEKGNVLEKDKVAISSQSMFIAFEI